MLTAETLDVLVDELVTRIADAVAAKVTEAIVAIPAQEPWRLLTAEEAGRLLGRSARWVYAASAVGSDTFLGLPFVLVAERKLYDPDDLKSWAKDRRVPAVEPRALTAESPQTGKTPGNRGLSRRQRIPIPTGSSGADR